MSKFLTKTEPILCCPIDKAPLLKVNNSLCCKENHSYDIAKQGYVNLLLNSDKNSNSPGDSKEMVIARYDFLNRTFYQPIAENISKLVMLLTEGDNKIILDAGCGEGYYLDYISKMCFLNNTNNMYGIDISKDAVKFCSQRNKNIKAIVATNANLPFADNSIDIIICMFGFPVISEFARVLKPNGNIIIVEPSDNHLLELKNIIYPVIKQSIKTNKLLDSGLFKKLKTENLEYQITADNSSLKDLLLMTPHFFRVNNKVKQELQILDKLDLTVSIESNIYSLSKNNV